MTKKGRAAQSTGWIVSSQSRVQAAQSTGWIVSSQRQFFRSREGLCLWGGGKVVLGLLPGRRPLADTGKPTQPSLRGLGSICKVDIGGKPGNGFCQLMMKIGQAAQSTGWIVSSQCRVQAAQSTGWIVSSQRQFFRSWEGPGTGGQVVAAPWATCPSVGWDLNLNQLCARPGMGERNYNRSAKSTCMLIVLLQSMRVEMYYFSPCVQRRTRRTTNSPCVQRRTTTDHAPVCAVLTQVHADAEMFPRRSWWRRTQPRRSWRSRMFPRRSWRSRMLPRRSWRSRMFPRRSWRSRRRGATLILPQPLFGSGCGNL